MSGLQSLRGRFPFSFGVTSYQYPADIAYNIEHLRGLVDEMELILFESAGASNIPTQAEVALFRGLAEPESLRFNVHLPLDIDIVSRDPATRNSSLDVVARLVERTAPLRPTSYTLHVLRDDAEPREIWRGRVHESLRGIEAPHDRFCVETLGWDLREIDDILAELGYSVCIDVGHLLLYGHPLAEFFRVFAGRISMIHLHGVKGKTDHLPLSVLGAEERSMIANAMRAERYTRSACLEVFSLKDFIDSIPALRDMFPSGGWEA
jgi:sugar phosphate isomerase/epimerase